MWKISEIKKEGKDAFKANYWKSVLVGLILTVIGGVAGGGASFSVPAQVGQSGQGTTIPLNELGDPATLMAIAAILSVVAVVVLVAVVISFIVKLFIINPIKIGGCYFFYNNVDSYGEVKDILDAFGGGYYKRSVLTMFLKDLYISLWSLLFVIPGIIKHYQYYMVPYIVATHPDYTTKEALQMSKDLMKGNKWHTFGLELSFIGWGILNLFTLNLLYIFFLKPYKENTLATLYVTLAGREEDAENE